MKKIYALALCLTLLTSFSCSKDDKETDEISGSLTVEEGKKQLEDNSIVLLNKIDNFKTNSALEEIIELAEYLSPAEGAKTGKFKKSSLNTISNISEIQATNNGLATFNAKQAIAIIPENSLAGDFNEEKGIYEWNPDTEEFDRISDSEDIIYNIAYHGKKAVFTITDFKTTIAGGDDTEELPTLVKANLKINNNIVFSQDYTATFQDGQLIPTKINNTTTIAEFSFVTSYTNANNSTIKQSFEFKLNKDVIIGYNYNVNGNFNNEDGNIEDIVNDATFSFQFLDAALSITAKDTGFDSDSDLTVNEQIALLNSNTGAELSINNKSVAKSQFYKDEYTYTDYKFNSNTQQYEEVEVTEDVVNARFLFKDGTTSDLNTYMDGSFTELEDKFDAVFDAYENLFSGIEI